MICTLTTLSVALVAQPLSCGLTTAAGFMCITCKRDVIYSLRVMCASSGCRAFHAAGEACHDCGDARVHGAAFVPHPDRLVSAAYAETLSSNVAPAVPSSQDDLSASVRPAPNGRTHFVMKPPPGFTLDPGLWYVIYTDGGSQSVDGSTREGLSGVGIVLEEHSAKPDFRNWSATRTRYIFKISEFLSKFGTADIAEFVAIARAMEEYSKLLPDADVQHLPEVATGNVWSPYLRFDRSSQLEHFSYSKLTRKSSTSGHLVPVLDVCTRIMTRTGVIPFVSAATHVRGHGDAGATQGQVNLIADVLATAGIERGPGAGQTDRSNVLWSRIATSLTWFRARDPDKIRKQKYRASLEAQRFIRGVAVADAAEPSQVAAGVGADPMADWPWSRAEDWFRSILDKVPPSDLCMPLAAEVSPQVRAAVNTWDRCFLKTKETIHPSAKGLYLQALSLCSQTAVLGSDVKRRGAGLLMLQLLPRLVLRPTLGKETQAELIGNFMPGRWTDLVG